MNKSKTKLITNILSLLILFNIPLFFANAETHGLEGVTNAFVNIINIAFLGSIAVFIIMLFVTAIKFGTSLGDPDGLTGAKQTLTYAIFGFLIAIGFYAIVTLIFSTFGVTGLESPGTKLQEGIEELMQFVGAS